MAGVGGGGGRKVGRRDWEEEAQQVRRTTEAASLAVTECWPPRSPPYPPGLHSAWGSAPRETHDRREAALCPDSHFLRAWQAAGSGCEESETVADDIQAGTRLSAGLVVSLWHSQATKGPGLWAHFWPAGQPAQTSICPFDSTAPESTLPQTRACGGGTIPGQLSNVKSDFERWGWGDLNPGGGGKAF